MSAPLNLEERAEKAERRLADLARVVAGACLFIEMGDERDYDADEDITYWPLTRDEWKELRAVLLQGRERQRMAG